mmetsp:Transcript_173615/g.551137  ORF Transcript_173615/g.551137 Transcript_173615/m.551137 type:complete len:90 (-) Transcript_173615:68-337(-)
MGGPAAPRRHWAAAACRNIGLAEGAPSAADVRHSCGTRAAHGDSWAPGQELQQEGFGDDVRRTFDEAQAALAAAEARLRPAEVPMAASM